MSNVAFLYESWKRLKLCGILFNATQKQTVLVPKDRLSAKKGPGFWRGEKNVPIVSNIPILQPFSRRTWGLKFVGLLFVCVKKRPRMNEKKNHLWTEGANESCCAAKCFCQQTLAQLTLLPEEMYLLSTRTHAQWLTINQRHIISKAETSWLSALLLYGAKRGSGVTILHDDGRNALKTHPPS